MSSKAEVRTLAAVSFMGGMLLGRLLSAYVRRMRGASAPAAAAASPARSLSSSAATPAGQADSQEEKKVNPNLAKRLVNYAGETVWHEFTPLAVECKAINLGQGFPGWNSPDFVKEALVTATNNNFNQYARSAGHLRLVKNVAAQYSKALGREVNPLTEVVVSVGASEGLFLCMQGLVNPGDEVIVLEPAFDIYLAQIDMVGGRVVPVPMTMPKPGQQNPPFGINYDTLEKAFTAKTRAIIINNPHNPTGKVLGQEDFKKLSEILRKFPNVVVIMDEVYQYLTYETKHQFFAAYPDMWNRTVTVGSAGKSFSITGWKVGWVVGPAALIQPLQIAHQWVSFSTANPLQEAVAIMMERAEQPYQGFPTYYEWLNQDYKRRRQKLADLLTNAGILPHMPDGSFFIMADTSNIKVPEKYLSGANRDYAVCRYLTREVGVAAIPPSAFFTSADAKKTVGHLARFAFCRTDEDLDEAARRLSKLKST